MRVQFPGTESPSKIFSRAWWLRDARHHLSELFVDAMPKFFTYELRQPPEGSGWSAYPTLGTALEPDDRRTVNEIFAHVFLLDELPDHLPWEGTLPLSGGQWTFVWRHPDQRRVQGALLSPKEWMENNCDTRSLLAGADPAFVAAFLSEIPTIAWPEVLEDDLPGVPLGPSCILYLCYAEAFRRKVGHERRTGFVSACKEGSPLPAGVSRCPFKVTVGGPGTLDQLGTELHRRVQTTLRERLTNEEKRRGDVEQRLANVLAQTDQQASLKEKIEELERQVKELQNAPRRGPRLGSPLLAASACLLAMIAITMASYSFSGMGAAERARDQAQAAQTAAETARDQARLAQTTAEKARDAVLSAQSAPAKARSNGQTVTPDGKRESAPRKGKKRTTDTSKTGPVQHEDGLRQ